tara:strand:+ start:139 stop:483 length:345 start_codon:yes stop_codon:yes gene_type:complete
MINFLKKYKFFLISLGAIPGALLRWQIDNIFIVNIVGCFLLGFVNAMPVSHKYKLIFCFGFCGSLTTFSGWSFQLYRLISEGLYKLVLFNSFLILLTGFFAIGLANFLAKKIIN